jgi:O-antigen/teichoic acid export membrane protein
VGRGGRLGLSPEARAAAGNLLRKAISLPLERLCGLALVVVAGQQLGEAGFGRYQFALTVTTLLALGTDLGLGVWTTRALARSRERARVVVGTALAVRALAAGPYLALTALAAVLAGPGDARGAFLFLGLASLAGAFVDYAGAVFRGHERFGDEARLNLMRATAVLALGLGGLALAGTASGLAAGVAAGTLLAALYGWDVMGGRYRLAGTTALDRALAREALGEGFPIWLAGLLSLLYFRGDALLLRLLAGEAELGAYSAAFKLFEGTMLVPAVLLTAVFPPLARAHGDRDRQRRWERTVLALLVLAGLLVGGVLLAARRPVITALFGEAFLDAVPSLAVLALGVPLLYVNYGLTHFLIARDLGRKNLLLAGAMLVLNVGVNLLAIPRLGGPGAALATVVTELALTGCCLWVLGVDCCNSRVPSLREGPADRASPSSSQKRPAVGVNIQK